MRATVTETSTTMEHGKLKLTLTRKSNPKGVRTTEDIVTVINKDGDTLWSGPVESFREFTSSLGGLYAAVDQELHGPKDANGCSCPTQHALDCSQVGNP